MPESIIKHTVMLDKKAREAIAKLEDEKFKLDQRIKEEAKTLKAELDQENEEKLAKAKLEYETDIETRKKKELAHFEKQLAYIKEQFEKNEDKWIEEIFEECVKA